MLAWIHWVDLRSVHDVLEKVGSSCYQPGDCRNLCLFGDVKISNAGPFIRLLIFLKSDMGLWVSAKAIHDDPSSAGFRVLPEVDKVQVFVHKFSCM